MAETNTRNYALDCMKGLLTLLMILCHCIQFFGQEAHLVQGFLVNYINLTTFSGFFFCFGFVSNKAYFEKKFGASAKKMLKNAGRMLIAFYVSEIAYLALVENKIFRMDLIMDVLLVKQYAGWSEFLISFAIVMLLGILLFPIFKRMNSKVFAVITLVSIVACFLPYGKQTVPQLAMLIGSTNYVTYPCLQYLLYFAFGVLLSKKDLKFNKYILVLCSLASVPCIWYYVKFNSLPMRFPPDWLYITGAFVFVYLYYLICLKLDSLKLTNAVIGRVVQYLCHMGSNSLFYLLLSNLLIFAFAGSAFTFRDVKYVIGFYTFLLLFIPYLIRIMRNESNIKWRN